MYLGYETIFKLTSVHVATLYHNQNSFDTTATEEVSEMRNVDIS